MWNRAQAASTKGMLISFLRCTQKLNGSTLKIAPRSKIAPRTDGRTDGWTDERTDGRTDGRRVTEIPEGGFAPPDPPTTPFQKICPPGKFFEMIETGGAPPPQTPLTKKKDGRKKFRPKRFWAEKKNRPKTRCRAAPRGAAWLKMEVLSLKLFHYHWKVSQWSSASCMMYKEAPPP